MSSHWGQSFDNQRVDFLKPIPENFSILNVARGLSQKCRFNGQTKFFYPVSQHSIIVSRFCSPPNKLWALFHEGDEVFLPDVPSPLKPLIAEWKTIAGRHEETCAKQYGLSLPMPDEVKLYDLKALHTEKLQLMGSLKWDDELPEAIDIIINPMTPSEAELAFIYEYRMLTENNPMFDSNIVVKNAYFPVLK